MDTHTHVCGSDCGETATVTAPFSAKLVLPPGWHWRTRRSEGLNAVAECGDCWARLSPMRSLRRVGPHGRAARAGARG